MLSEIKRNIAGLINNSIVKGVLIDFNQVLEQFWGHIRTQDTRLPLEKVFRRFFADFEKKRQNTIFAC